MKTAMKTALKACATLLVCLAFAPTPANAGAAATGGSQMTEQVTAQVAALAGDFSAARKHRKVRQRVHIQRDDYYRSLEANRSFGFIGAYPGEYARRRSLGQTVCDLGYGRWDACESN